MRYQVVPVDGALRAAGSRYKLTVTFDADQRFWRAEIASVAPSLQPDWSAVSPDLAHLLVTALAALRTLDTDGLL